MYTSLAAEVTQQTSETPCISFSGHVAVQLTSAQLGFTISTSKHHIPQLSPPENHEASTGPPIISVRLLFISLADGASARLLASSQPSCFQTRRGLSTCVSRSLPQDLISEGLWLLKQLHKGKPYPALCLHCPSCMLCQHCCHSFTSGSPHLAQFPFLSCKDGHATPYVIHLCPTPAMPLSQIPSPSTCPLSISAHPPVTRSFALQKRPPTNCQINSPQCIFLFAQ
ncbi:hypothetical protein BKA63DRAFT_210505 [Paraphoma chrysanthemicola]|nr:hypothetical protein BKA63DRAFT_210505 [Paraphoma chrysanthemicola]